MIGARYDMFLHHGCKGGLVAVLALLLTATASEAYTIRIGTYVCNPEATVTVPVELDTAKGLAYASLRINYDSQFLVCTKVEQGSLKTVFPDEFSVRDSGAGSLSIASFRSDDATGTTGGSLALLTFAIRPGTEKLYSDIAIADVELGDSSGIRDLKAQGATIETTGGMIRAFGSGDGVERLENEQTIVAKTALRSLDLQPGDALQAADDGAPVLVSEEVRAAGPIPIAPPDSGWEGGTYTLLTTKTKGLGFVSSTNRSEKLPVQESAAPGGLVSYAIVIPAKDDIRIQSAAAGETLSNPQKAFVRSFAAGEKGLETIVVEGGVEAVDIARNLGLSPVITRTGVTMTTAFAAPKLRITEFDPLRGTLKVLVEPQNGTTIARPLVTGVVHLQGTPSLHEQMKDLAATDVEIMADGYLSPSTKGEFGCTAQLGKNAFFRIVVKTDDR